MYLAIGAGSIPVSFLINDDLILMRAAARSTVGRPSVGLYSYCIYDVNWALVLSDAVTSESGEPRVLKTLIRFTRLSLSALRVVARSS